MSYLDEGPRSDEAVLMVHGNPTWSFFYRNVVFALRDRMCCIVPDHLGCGLSDKPQDYDYTLGNHINNLSALVDSLKLRKVHLVVHDWGGPIGLGTMLPLGDKLGRVVILNTAAFSDTVIPLRIRFCRWPVIGEIAVRGFNAFAWPATWMAVTKPLPPAVKDGFLFPYNSWANRIATHRFVRDIPRNKGQANDAALAAIEKALPELRTKAVRILWGGKDFCFNEHYYHRWTALLPNAKADYLAETGHYLLEDAREECVAELSKHLTS